MSTKDTKPDDLQEPRFGRMLTEAEILREEIARTRAMFWDIAASQLTHARKLKSEFPDAAEDCLTRRNAYQQAGRSLSDMLGRVTRRMKGK